MKHLTPIIDVTDKCNLTCRYCYSGSAHNNFASRDKINQMFRSNIQLLFEFTDQVMAYNQNNPTIFIFHGGEPLLVTIENWDRVFTYFRKNKYPIEIDIQTNGILIHQDFIDLFKEFDVKLGVSLDGPKSLNDETRIFKSGKGSFSVIFRNLQKMKESEFKFGCLVTLNRANMDMDGIYNFFKEYQIHFNVRPIFDHQYSVPEELLITSTEYASAICKLFDFWFDDQDSPSLIGDFNNMVARFIEPIDRLTTCSFAKCCNEEFVAFDIQGDLWPCNCLPKNPFYYGNINEYSLDELLAFQKAEKLSTRWDKLLETDCKDCEVSNFCYGGCPSRAYYSHGSYFAKDPLCEAYRTILKHVYGKIETSFEDS